MSTSSPVRPPNRPAPRWISALSNVLLVAGAAGLVWIGYSALNPPAPEPAKNVEASAYQTEGRVVQGTSGPLAVIFEDPMCPHCRDLEREYGARLKAATDAGKLRILRLHFAFLGEDSTRIAQTLACAERREPARFPELMHEVMTSPMDRAIDQAFFMAALPGAGYDRVADCVQSGDGMNYVKADLDLGKAAQVPGTPLIQLEGRTVPSAEALLQAVGAN